jgi:uncharacterized protein (DUF885 family)
MCRSGVALVSLLVPAAVIAAACNRQPPAPRVSAGDTLVRALADEYLEGYFDRYPEQATVYGVPRRRHDALFDNSLEALQEWKTRENAWLLRAARINPVVVDNASLRATHAILKEALEGSVAMRSCRLELWSVSQFVNGWQVQLAYLASIQPVGTDEARREALARWSALPKFIDTEIANLREGLAAGYSAPAGNVRIVIDQMNTLIATPLAESPFDSPSVRDKAPEFRSAFDALVRDQLVPAFRRYRDFLQREYLPAARVPVAVSFNPSGQACYEAAIRAHSGIRITAKDVHEIGLRQIDLLTREMQAIAERSFQTRDVPALLQRLRTDPRYLFKSRQELISYSQDALARAKAAAPQWFGLLPKADVVIEPYPVFREKNGSNEYNPPAEDGSRPGLFYISAYEAEKQSRAGAESTAFHETFPGHHLQGSIALERGDSHPLGRYLGNSGYLEGWALYTERLADEMKLYSSDLDRLGMLSSQALRAARLVVDTGLHSQGWSRQQAIDYMLAHTAESREYLEAEVDRYIIYPGQATSYMLGMLEIQKAREAARQSLGARFDIKAFHDRVLEDGAVPLSFLSDKIVKWAAEAAAAP